MNPFFHLLFQSSRMISSELNEVLKKYNLYSSQWTVLYCIHSNGSMSLTSMGKYLNVEAPTITRTVSRLEELGWIKIHQGKDRREKIVSLSKKTNEKFPEIEQSILEFEANFAKSLSPDEQKQLIFLLHKLKEKE